MSGGEGPVVRGEEAQEGHEGGAPERVLLVVAGAVGCPVEGGEGWAALEEEWEEQEVVTCWRASLALYGHSSKMEVALSSTCSRP